MVEDGLSPRLVLAVGVAGAFVILALGVAVSLLINAAALAIAILAGGAAAAGIASWVIPVVAVGIGATGLAGGYNLVVVFAKELDKQPVVAFAPLFGLLGGLATDLVSASSNLPTVAGIALGGITSATLIGGSLLWRRPGSAYKIAGGILILVTPLTVLWEALRSVPRGDLGQALTNLDQTTLGSIVLLMTVMAGLAALLFADGRRGPTGS
jgi:hypothetical protein